MATQDDAPRTVFDRQYGSREVLALLAEKWVTMVLYALAGGTKRHGELRREIAGISQKMLTETLRRLERDGLVARTQYPQVPPRVDYALTPLGQTLGTLVGAICEWATAHYHEIEAARTAYDRQPRRTGER
jgi:DNA-binding HxlR family transcriptional regulator